MLIQDKGQWALSAAIYYSRMDKNRNIPQETKNLFEEEMMHILGVLREHRIIYDRFAGGQSEIRSTEFGKYCLSYQNPLFDTFLGKEWENGKNALGRREKREEYLKRIKTEKELARILSSKLDEIIKAHEKIMEDPAKATEKEICEQKEFFLRLSRKISAYSRNVNKHYLAA